MKTGRATPEKLSSIYSALNNAAVPFETSARDLIRTISQSTEDAKEALAFASALSPEYKTLAITIRDNSKAAGLEVWGQAFFTNILQNRPSIEQLRSWNETWTAALAFTQREKSRTSGEFGSSNEWKLKRVIEIAAKELWSSADFTAVETFAVVARFKNLCNHDKGISSLIDCVGMELFSKQKGKLLDPTLSDRYVVLARDYAVYLEQFAKNDWTSLGWALVDEFFTFNGPIWSKCDLKTFDQRAIALKSQVNAILRASDQFKKWDLER